MNSTCVAVKGSGIESEVVASVIDGYSKTDYLSYADGDIASDLFAFRKMERPWDYNDKVTWGTIFSFIQSTPGIRNVIDIGTGAGTWSFRIARAFPELEVVGFDICGQMIDNAKSLKGTYFPDLADRVNFYEGDACDIPENNSSYGLSICLHDILNHIQDYGIAISEMTRVAKNNITSVHSINGPRTFLAVSPDDVREWSRDGDWLRFTTYDNDAYNIFFHLFDVNEVRQAFEKYSHVSDIFGVDIHISNYLDDLRRMKPDLKINGCLTHLQNLENKLKHDLAFINHAGHIMILSSPYKQ